MMKLAVTGAGNVGGTLGKSLARKGHEVVYGVSSDAKADRPDKKPVAEAIGDAEAVILATPWPVSENLVRQHASGLAGKIVIDATNPLKPDLSGLATGADTSGAETLQRAAPLAKFYKAFNTTGFQNMAQPMFPEGPAVMFIAGPTGVDMETVKRIVADVGFEAVDAGDVKAARLLEPLAMLWIHLTYAKGFGRDWAFRIARRK
jgi:8-hydroxy-5-deazaflavin:NADPH oxidoreductase